MITYPEALDLLLANVSHVNTEIVELSHAIGKTCAKIITANESIPAFANSAMDGFAVQTNALKHCSDEHPVHLKVIAAIAAGDSAHYAATSPLDTCEIMTGAVVPSGYDAVIPIEYVKFVNPNEIVITQSLKPGQNIRFPGEDFQINDVILTPGEIITPKHIMILATFGITQIPIYRPLTVAILSTGNELVSIETKQLATGQIRNSNGIYIAHYLQQLGVNATFIGSFADDVTTVKNKIEQLSTVDLIITTGAVSAGKWDFIPTLLHALQANILFHKVAIRPGKPILAATVKDHTYFLGFPGNPIASVVGLRFFALPLIYQLHGRTIEKPIIAKLNTPIQKKHRLHTFYKAFSHVNSQGECMVNILSDQESFKMKPLLTANCWAVLQDERDYAQHEYIHIYQDI
jgi:molybdopterin molybdotransferase